MNPFSKNLTLTNALIERTDVGPIPRRLFPMGGDYRNHPNWSRSIIGCYWCASNDELVYSSITCSKDCHYFFHEWCVDKVLDITNIRFCRNPDCKNEKPVEDKKLFCSTDCENNVDTEIRNLVKTSRELYPKWYIIDNNTDPGNPAVPLGTFTPLSDAASQYYNTSSDMTSDYSSNAEAAYSSDYSSNAEAAYSSDYSSNAVAAYSNDYSSNAVAAYSSDYSSNNAVAAYSSDYSSNNAVATYSNAEDNCQPFLLEISPALCNIITYCTDIGPIPKIQKNISTHCCSLFSQSPNWQATLVKACYYCGKYLHLFYDLNVVCSIKCAQNFHEWCRQKVIQFTDIKYCQIPGCGKIASHGYECCTQTHGKRLQTDYNLADLDVNKLLPPRWYDDNSFKQFLSQTHNFNLHNKDQLYLLLGLTFSPVITNALIQFTDVGPLPRSIIEDIQTMEIPTDIGNWCREVTGCYWCCAADVSYSSLICSLNCFYLLHEWCIKKVLHFTGNRYCKLPKCGLETYNSCDEFCCDEHLSVYNIYFETCLNSQINVINEIALGPNWYHETSDVNFYNNNEPLYEFTNFYDCQNLIIDGKNWTTSEHYFQAQKFIDTPLVEQVRRLKTPREAFSFTRKESMKKWIIPNWHSTKLDVMLKVLRFKFEDERFRSLLIRTQDRHIFEHTSSDKYWGDGGDGTGENKLGHLLMEVRQDLQSKYHSVYSQWKVKDTFLRRLQIKNDNNNNNNFYSNNFIDNNNNNNNNFDYNNNNNNFNNNNNNFDNYDVINNNNDLINYTIDTVQNDNSHFGQFSNAMNYQQIPPNVQMESHFPTTTTTTTTTTTSTTTIATKTATFTNTTNDNDNNNNNNNNHHHHHHNNNNDSMNIDISNESAMECVNSNAVTENPFKK